MVDGHEMVTEDTALELLGEVVDWLGAPDWSGPQMSVELGRRIAAVLAPSATHVQPQHHRPHPHQPQRCVICYRPWPCPAVEEWSDDEWSGDLASVAPFVVMRRRAEKAEAEVARLRRLLDEA